MRISVPLEVKKEIETDKGSFSATFVQPRQQQHITHDDFRQEMIETRGFLTWGHVQSWEVYLLIRECDLKMIDAEGKEGPIWNAMQMKQGVLSYEDFMKGWGILDADICQALWQAAVEVAPDWDWRRVAVEEDGEELSFQERSDVPETSSGETSE